MATVAMQNDQGIVGVPTGLSDLDEKLGGLHKSDLIILAGRPSMGKTALATNIAYNVAQNILKRQEKSSVAFFSSRNVIQNNYLLEFYQNKLGLNLTILEEEK